MKYRMKRPSLSNSQAHPVHPEGRAPICQQEGRDHALLDVSEHLFLTHGYDHVSVDLIARTAGVATPSIYAHFGGKRGLLEVVIERGCAREFECIAILVQKKCRPEEALVALAVHALEHALSARARLLYADTIADRDFDLGRKLNSIRSGPWGELLREVMTSQEWQARSRFPPEVACDLFIGCVLVEQHTSMHADVGCVLTGCEVETMARRATDNFFSIVK